MAGTAYQTADGDVRKVVNEAIDSFHKRLRDVNLELGVLVAQNLSGPGVRHNGYPALATIRVVPLKDRVTKGYDAELLIDEREWNSMRPQHRLALCDHELTHLVIVKDKKSGEVKRDDLGRPKLKTQKGDWNGGDGFAEVVERHGDFAVEFLNAQRAFTKAKSAAARKPSLLDGIEPATESEKNPDREPAAGIDDEKTEVEISSGGRKVKTTLGGMKRVAKKLEEENARAESKAGKTNGRRKVSGKGK